MGEFKIEARKPDHHQDIGNIGIADDLENPIPESWSIVLFGETFGLQGDLACFRVTTRPSTFFRDR